MYETYEILRCRKMSVDAVAEEKNTQAKISSQNVINFDMAAAAAGKNDSAASCHRQFTL